MNLQTAFSWFDGWLDRVADFVEKYAVYIMAAFVLVAAGKVFKVRLGIGK